MSKATPPAVGLPDVAPAQRALQQFWATSGTSLGAADVAEACRKLTVDQLRWVESWVPTGQGQTELKCSRAREIVRGIINEKGGK